MCKYLCFLVLLFSTFAEELPKMKNVVVILADDHALKVTGIYGNKTVRTPNIDRLASQGVLFERAYCNAPICSASRQSLLTGKYPHATGVNLLFTPFPDHGNTTIAEHLKSKGYATGLFGKDHFNNWVWGNLYKKSPKHGFDTIVSKQYQKYLKDKNPKPIPEWLQMATKDAVAHQREIWKTAVNDTLEKLIKEGIEIVNPDKKAFQKKVEPLYEKLKQEKNPLYPLVEAIREVKVEES